RWRVPRSDSEADVAVHRCQASGAIGIGQGVQRQGAGGSDRSKDAAGHQARPAAAGLCLAEGRRNYVLRELDLLRLLDRGGTAVDAPWDGRSIGHGRVSELGMVVASESPRAV